MSGNTDLGIANLALIDLGQPALASITDESKAGRLFRAQYEPTVKEVLRSHPWRCCRAQIILTPDTDQPPFHFQFKHELPADFIKVVKFNNHIDKFEVIGNRLHCDDNAPELTYVARVPTVQFDPGLESTIAARLSWRWCKPLTDSANDIKAFQAIYESISADAKFADALDGAPEDPPLGTWAEARLSQV